MKTSRERKTRADLLLVERGLAPSRAKAQALIMAGLVDVNGTRMDKAGTLLPENVVISVRLPSSTYVSRGGDKLAGALKAFLPHGLSVKDKVAADFGASTGGFVDCLLQHGAAKVHAIDVGRGLLHERLRNDPRVVVRERTNARHVTPQVLGEAVDLVVIDVSFIGLSKVLGAAHGVLAEGGEVVALIKPQFEAGRQEVSRGRGVIRDEAIRERIIGDILEVVVTSGFGVVADAPCEVLGPKGNREHFFYGRKT